MHRPSRSVVALTQTGKMKLVCRPPKTAIELAMEEAEEYERRKEAEQRRLLGGATV